ncbi:MAG: APC family permease [Planctomycetes bacterium]|nr:APC family permease [Planctomycetota bacterium]
MASERRWLLRILGPLDGAAVSIGVAVGVGIFRAPGEVARHFVGTESLILVAWLLGGLYAFLDAQVLAELSAMMPRAGGWYAYIRRAYGPFPAFLYGWSSSLITYPGSVAALAVPFSEYLSRAVPGMPGGVTGAAIVALVLLTALNAAGLRVGRTAQNGLTVVKLAGLVALGVGLMTTHEHFLTQVKAVAPPSLSAMAVAMGLALQPVLWSYDGYGDVVTLGEEVHHPGRNVPRAIAIAVGSITVLYVFLNFGLLKVLGPKVLADSDLPAGVAAGVVFGRFAETFIIAVALVTILDSMNAQLLSGPRITYAMARDGLFFDFATRVTAGGTPIGALLLQAGAALAFILVIPDFDQLVSLTIFVIWLAGVMNVIALFKLRRREPDLPRPFRVIGYPWAPALLLVAAGLLLVNMLINDRATVWKGLAVIGAGVPIYWGWMRARRMTPRPQDATS